jgi:hypothetical protein
LTLEAEVGINQNSVTNDHGHPNSEERTDLAGSWQIQSSPNPRATGL